jgi:hypothetical protein
MYKISLKPHYMAWQILQRGLIVREGEQHNLVLNQASDLMAVHGMDGITNYAMVGTGTSAPNAAQTQLQAELVRTNFVPSGEADSITRVSSGVYDIRRVRQFSAVQIGGQILGEWGFSPVASGLNNAAVREVFRDGGGVPTPIVLTGVQQLRLIYVTRVDLNPKFDAASAHSLNIVGIGNRSGLMYLCDAITLPPNRPSFDAINALIRGADVSLRIHSTRTPPNNNAIFYGTALKTLTPTGAYVAGTKQRSYNPAVWSVTDYVGVVAGFAISNATKAGGEGLAFMFDVGQEFTKASTHTLTLNSPFGVSWT